MYQPLVACSSCHRHVRVTEVLCPFCAAALPADLASRAVPPATSRMSRAAAFVFGASLTITACGSDVSSEDSGGASGDSTSDGAGASSSSGGGDPDGGSTEMDAGPGPDDDGGVVAMYGDPPPMDAGPDDAGPPPEDAGDDGGIQPPYGAAPPPKTS